MRLFLLLTLAACGGSAPESQFVWNGFGYEWETLSHRLSLVQAMMTETGGAEVGMIGGDWSTGATFSDLPTVRSRTLEVRSAEVVIIHGETSLTLDRNEPMTVSASTQLPEGWEGGTITPVLRGIRLNTDVPQGTDYPDDYDPGLGYTSSGLAYSVGTSELVGTEVSFPVSGQVFWGPQDRANMNNAMTFAQSEMVVGWSVIFHEGQRTDEALAASATYPRQPPNSEHPDLGAEDLGLTSSGDNGFAVIRGVNLRLQDQEGTDEGSYWRRIGFEVVRGASSEAHGYAMATNSSLLEEIAVTASVEADVSWIELTKGRSEVEEHLIEEEHEVGEAFFP